LSIRRLVLLVGALVLGYVAYVGLGLPPRRSVRNLARTIPDRTALMRQREEEARSARRQPRHEQIWVPLTAISRHLIEAVLVAEDPKFFGHEGIDWDAIRESVETNVKTRHFARGGSTITQQLAKNLFFTTRKSPTRKIRELVVAGWLEADLSKRRILEIYLNVIEWGDGVYGCEAAARRYYQKPALQLEEAESAGLAAMIPSPRRLNPRVDPARHAGAQRRVLWLMAHAGYVRGLAGLGAEPPRIEPAEEGEDLPEEAQEAPEPSALPDPLPEGLPSAAPTTDLSPSPESPSPPPPAPSSPNGS